MQANPATRGFGVLNAGIGGNRVRRDASGPSLLACFDRDVTGQTVARFLIVLGGIHDLDHLTVLHPVPQPEHATMVRDIIGTYEQIVERAHAQGIRVMGATFIPDGGSDHFHPDALDNADRQAINDWIRAPGHFDASVDFDQVVRDPAHPERILPAYDSGDHLHPSVAGYHAMAAAIPLAFFRNSAE